MSEQEAVAYIEEWDATEAAKVLKWYEEDELLRPCDCDTMVAIETEDLKAENVKLRERVTELEELTDGKRYIPQEWYAQLMAENAKLRQQLADVTESMSRVEERCAKLRELVCKVEHFESAGCFECPHSCGGFLYDDSCLMRREIEQDKRALGIEVVDAS